MLVISIYDANAFECSNTRQRLLSAFNRDCRDPWLHKVLRIKDSGGLTPNKTFILFCEAQGLP